MILKIPSLACIALVLASVADASECIVSGIFECRSISETKGSTRYFWNYRESHPQWRSYLAVGTESGEIVELTSIQGTDWHLGSSLSVDDSGAIYISGNMPMGKLEIGTSIISTPYDYNTFLIKILPDGTYDRAVFFPHISTSDSFVLTRGDSIWFATWLSPDGPDSWGLLALFEFDRSLSLLREYKVPGVSWGYASIGNIQFGNGQAVLSTDCGAVHGSKCQKLMIDL